MKAVVAYYTKSGSTAKVAAALAEKLGAEARRIDSVKQYGFMGMGGMSFFNIRMPIKPMDLDFSGCDTVVLLAPVWAGKMACPGRTFLREARLEGKKLAVLFTCGGSGIDGPLKSVRREIGGRPVELVASDIVATDKKSDADLKQAGQRFADRLNAGT